MGRIQPVVSDRRLRAVHGAHAVHEGGRSERRLARQADVGVDAVGRRQLARVAGRQLHEEVVRMLAIDQRVDPIRRLARRQQQRIARPAHQGIGAEHGAQVQLGSIGEVAARGAHHHARRKGLCVAPQTVLVVVDEVQQGMAHQRPVADPRVHAAVLAEVRLPGGAGGVAGHGPGPERAGHAGVAGGGVMVHGLVIMSHRGMVVRRRLLRRGNR